MISLVLLTVTSAPKSVSGKRKTNCVIVGFRTFLHACTVAELETQVLVKGSSSQRQVKCVLDLSLEQLIKLLSSGLSIHLKEIGMQKLFSFFVFWSEINLLLLSFDNLSNCFVYFFLTFSSVF